MIGQIFVYGSLMSGFYNHNEILRGKVIKCEKGFVLGTLYHLREKGYPGFVPIGETHVYGEILTLEDFEMVVEKMDLLEGYYGCFSPENEYNRMQVSVINSANHQSKELDVYVYNINAFNNYFDERIRVVNGCWKSFMKELEA